MRVGAGAVEPGVRKVLRKCGEEYIKKKDERNAAVRLQIGKEGIVGVVVSEMARGGRDRAAECM